MCFGVETCFEEAGDNKKFADVGLDDSESPSSCWKDGLKDDIATDSTLGKNARSQTLLGNDATTSIINSNTVCRAGQRNGLASAKSGYSSQYKMEATAASFDSDSHSRNMTVFDTC